LSNDELKVNIIGGHGFQTHDQVIKRWGKAHEKYHVHTFTFSIFTSMECNWSASAFTMLMCASKFSPSYILMLKNLLRRNNLFSTVLASWTSQSVSQASQYWMCASCAHVRCSQSNANALVTFSL
jgi:hypothetical protein